MQKCFSVELKSSKVIFSHFTFGPYSSELYKEKMRKFDDVKDFPRLPCNYDSLMSVFGEHTAARPTSLPRHIKRQMSKET